MEHIKKIREVFKKISKITDRVFYIGLVISFVGVGIPYVLAQENSVPVDGTTSTDAPITTTQYEQVINPDAPQGGLFNPNQAEAGILDAIKPVETLINVMCAAKSIVGFGGCEPERGSWGRGFILRDLFADTIVLGFCENTIDDAIDLAKVDPYSACGDPTAVITYAPSKPGEFARYPHGGAGMLASTFDYLEKEAGPPTDLALFINDTTKNNVLGVQPAYAQTVFENDFKTFVLSGWRMTRNISLGLMGVVVGISALMVMFRAQIAPRVSVSVYNVLPMIPIGLGLILLSYPIITLVLSMMWPLQAFAANLGWAIARESFLSAGPLAAADNVAGGALIITAFGLVIGGLVSAGLGNLLFLIIVGVLIIAIAWVLISVAWVWAKIYMSMMFNTIVAPLIILSSMLPGRSGVLINFAKRLLVDLLSIPLMLFTLLIGLAVLAYSPGFYTGWSSAVGQSGSPAASPGWYYVLAYIMKYFIGLGIIWKAKDARKSLEGLVGVSDLWGMASPEKKR